MNMDVIVNSYQEMEDEQKNKYVVIEVQEDGFDMEIQFVKTSSKVVLKQLALFKFPARVMFVKKTSQTGYDYYDIKVLQ